MKKLLVLLFVLGVSIPSFAQLKEKDVVGRWTYSFTTDMGPMTGSLKFEIEDGKLIGEVSTDNSEVFKFTKIEIRDNNVLYLELKPEYDVMAATITVEGKEFKGMVGDPSGKFEVTGERVE